MRYQTYGRSKADWRGVFDALMALFVLVMFMVAYFRDWSLRQVVFWGVMVLLSAGQTR